jgi:hypothetical protein
MNRPIWIPDSYPKFRVLRFEAKLENLLEYDSGFHMGWFTKKQRLKISCYCPFKILSITKKTWWKKKIIIPSYSTAKNMPKIAEVKVSTCGFEVADFGKNCNRGIAELRLQSNISLTLLCLASSANSNAWVKIQI